MKFVFSHRFVVVLRFFLFSLSAPLTPSKVESNVAMKKHKTKIQWRENIWYWLNFYFSIFTVVACHRSEVPLLFRLELSMMLRGISNSWKEKLRNHLSQLSLFGYSIIVLFIESFLDSLACLFNLKYFPSRSLFVDEFFMRRSVLCFFLLTLLRMRNCTSQWRLGTLNATRIGFETVQIAFILALQSTLELNHNLMGRIWRTLQWHSYPLHEGWIRDNQIKSGRQKRKKYCFISSLTKAGNPPGFPCST